MAFFELDQVFTYQDVNEIKKLWPSITQLQDDDTSVEEGEVRLDLTENPGQLKRRTSAGWEVISEMSAQRVLEKLIEVHGEGSLLDADKLDGQEGSFYRNAANINAGTLDKGRLPAEVLRTDQNSDVSANTEWQDGMEARFGSDADFRIKHSSEQTTLNNHTGDLFITNVDSGKPIYITAHQSDGTWRTMLKLDPAAGTNGSLLVPSDNLYFRIGTSGDLWLYHNGTNSYMDNTTGIFKIRQLSNGDNLQLDARNTAGTVLTMMDIDPDNKTVQANGAVLSQMFNETIANNAIFDTGIPRNSVGTIYINYPTGNAAANGAIYQMGGNLLNNNGMSKTLGGNAYGVVKDQYDLNVYCESTGNLKIQNISGASVTLLVGFVGVNIS